MDKHPLGKEYRNNETICRQGEKGTCMYVIQSGTVEVIQEHDGTEVHLADLSAGNIFGEMALFTDEHRSASVRAKGNVTVLSVDKRTLLRRIQQDPSMAFNIMERLSERVGAMDDLSSRIRATDRRNWATRPETLG